jgi:DNA-binding transcriptional regulator YdaS (Cro superfamily)
MDLTSYLNSDTAPSLTDLARRAGVSPGHLHDIKSGRRTPSMALAAKIVAETYGAVSFEDLAPEMGA